MSTFSQKLQAATNEDKQVNPIYVAELKKEIPRVWGGSTRIETDSVIYPQIKTDGIFQCYYINDSDGLEYNYLLQLECKLDIDFTNAKDRANVLLQVCCYLKQIHNEYLGYNGTWESNAIPRVVVLGSKINCMALPVKLLIPHAMTYITGHESASTAHLRPENKFILENITRDSQIQMHSIVYDTSDKECIKRLCQDIVKTGKGLKITDDLNEHTVSLAFDFFDMYVLDKKSSSKISSREKVDLFIGTFFNEEFEEAKTNRWSDSADKLRIHGIEVRVDPDKYNQFKLLYNMREYSRLEQKQITAITDRLIEDTDRRRKGDFYTPSIWVDEAHKLLDKNLGENWRDEYMVWDCAWGTGNLTRDYKFADLYCSTLQEEDLNIGYRYNKGAVKFQYDFLNDDVEAFENVGRILKSPFAFKTGVNLSAMEKYINFKDIEDLYVTASDKGIITLEEGMKALQDAIRLIKSTKLYQNAPGLIDGLLGLNGKDKKKLLFLINPPYGTANSRNEISSNTGSKNGMALTKINEIMNDEKIGKCSQQLYAQFMYRIHLIKNLFQSNISIGMFTPSLYISSETFYGLRMIYNDCEVTDSFMLQANQFANVSGNWGIMFSIISPFTSKKMNITNTRIMEYNGNKVQEKEQHIIYAVENSCSNWVKEPIKKFKTCKDIVSLTSSIGIYSGDKSRGALVDGALGYFVNIGNKVEDNQQDVYILSAPASRGNGISILNANFDRVISNFTARALISGEFANWINGHAEYMIPDTNHPLYKQWENDSIIYSLYNSKSNQSSLRNIYYNGKQWNIQNEFFWISYGDIEDLAGGRYNTDDINTTIEDDIEDFGKERFVYKKLQEVNLSEDAQKVLDKATELVKSSFKYRKQFNQSHPEYHINTWDAGWYQIKGMLKEYDPQGLKEFNELYKALEDRMRDLVYELGFLYR